MVKRKAKSKQKKDINKVVTPVFRVSFANVFQARVQENEDGTTGAAKYSIVMLFDEDEDLSKLERLVNKAVKEKWGDKKPKNLRYPFRDAEEKEDLDGFEPGMIFCTATSLYRPGIVDRDLEPILDPEEFYSGCYARATINAYTYDKKGNRGVGFGLQNLQKIRDGERLAGRRSAEEDFDAVDDDDDWDN